MEKKKYKTKKKKKKINALCALNMFRALDKREYLMIIEYDFSYFSFKPYVVTPYLNRLSETVQMSSHIIWFYAEFTKIIPTNKKIIPHLDQVCSASLCSFSGILRPEITVKYIAVFIIFFNSGISLKSEVRFSVAFNQLFTRYISEL